MAEFISWLDWLASIVPTIAVIITMVALTLITIWILARILRFYGWIRQEAVYLELTPPSRTDRASQATQQLFAALHGMGMSRRWRDRLLMRQSLFAFEIVSTKSEGIRFLVRISREDAGTLERTIAAYLPEVKVASVNEQIKLNPSKKSRIVEFRQKQHFAFPLQNHETLEIEDPIAYITSAMTKLAPSERMVYQMVVTPVHVPQADTLSHKILSNEDLLPRLKGNRSYASPITTAINSLLFGLIGAVGNLVHGPSKSDYRSAQKDLEYQKQVAKRLKPARTLSYFEHELVESIHQKLAEPLFRVELRVLLDCADKQEILQRQKSLESALSLFNVPRYQGLTRKGRCYGWFRTYQNFRFAHRLPAVLRSANLLAATELSGLFHFPHSVTAKTENVIKSLSKTLPAPVSLKNDGKLDVLLGENQHQGTTTTIGLAASERERHIYILGGTGNGKTTMLRYGIVQDIKNGKGLAVIDPHGDLAASILRHIPQDRINDVIYLNPDDVTHPIGLNLLELPQGLSADDLLREKDLVTEATISVMRKLFSDDDSGGHRIEYVLRNAIQTALTIEDATLFTIFELLNDTKYRQAITRNLEDKYLKNFWRNELGKAGTFQKVKMAAGITAKIGRFLFSASAKRILEQPKSTIDFDDILNSGKILICNFSKGLLGEDTSTLFGTTVLAKLQLASLRRARLDEHNRQPFYLYVDEFQNFATMAFVQMLSEARKYRLFLTLAEQSAAQQEEQKLVEIILANVGTIICFRSGSPADERLVLPLFKPFLESGEIANLPAYNFYMRIAALQAQEPMSGVTVLLKDDGSENIAKEVISASRRNHAIRFRPKTENKRPVARVTTGETEVKRAGASGGLQPALRHPKPAPKP